MASLHELLLLTPRISTAEVRVTVLAAIEGAGAAERLRLEGRIGGPRCAYAKTLDASFPLRPEAPRGASADAPLVQAGGVILEPCFWEPEHPFLYEARVELWEGEQRHDGRTLTFGAGRLECRPSGLWLNARPFVLEAARFAGPPDSHTLRRWHDAGCAALWIASPSAAFCDLSDVWGPALLAQLPPALDAMRQTVAALRNRPSVWAWVCSAELRPEELSEYSRSLRRLDPVRPLIWAGAPERALLQDLGVNLRIVVPSVEKPVSSDPTILLAAPESAVRSSPESFTQTIERFRAQWNGKAGVAGWIV